MNLSPGLPDVAKRETAPLFCFQMNAADIGVDAERHTAFSPTPTVRCQATRCSLNQSNVSTFRNVIAFLGPNPHAERVVVR